MSIVPAEEVPLRERVDKPDLADALANDPDGDFAADVNNYLEEWQAKIKSLQDAGLAQVEYQNLDRLSAGIEAACRVVKFFVELKKLPPTR